MIRERLHDLEIKITELADYLQISRPTLYKAIEDYDSGNKQGINPKILSLFDYISGSELIGKRNVIGYILNELPKVDDKSIGEGTSAAAIVYQAIKDNPTSEKSRFVVECTQSPSYDVAIHYLMEISPILKKEKLTIEEKEIIKPYLEILKIYSLNNKGDKER